MEKLKRKEGLINRITIPVLDESEVSPNQWSIDNFVEVELQPMKSGGDSFLAVCETLTRIGLANYRRRELYQSCHLLHKKIDGEDRYFIVHFKEMFLLDGRRANLSTEDIARRNTIAQLLEDWNLIKIKHPEKLNPKYTVPEANITILPYKQKSDWSLISKYTIGKIGKKTPQPQTELHRKGV